MVIAQDESLSKHMRKMVHVGGTGGGMGGKGVLLTGKEICLQHFICSLVFNAVLALCPVNRPAFPFSSGARGAKDGTDRAGARILGD